MDDTCKWRGRGYCDLNIPCVPAASPKSDSRTKDLVDRALALGYSTLALNVHVNQKDLVTKNNKQQQQSKKADGKPVLFDFPEPPSLSFLNSSEKAGNGSKAPLVLTRLTLTFHNNDFLTIYNNSKSAKSFDILALRPTSTAALQNLLKAGFRADIISFDPEESTGQDERDKYDGVRWTRKLYMECVEKHMFFEILYGPCIRDQEARLRSIRQAHVYHAVGRSKNIILSSSASDLLDFRGPHDVANLGRIFGLNEEQGLGAVSSTAIQAVKAASGRKLGPYRAIIQTGTLPLGERWKAPPRDPDTVVKRGAEESGKSSDSEVEEEHQPPAKVSRTSAGKTAALQC